MAQHVLLNNVDHQQVRVLTRRCAALGDAEMLAHTFPAEFRHLQAHYPIVYQKTADGLSFQAVALLGLQAGQNLFLSPEGEGSDWDAAYVPLSVQRHPFLIGRDGEGLVVHIDMDSPRISAQEGEWLFLPHGGASPYLQHMSTLLAAIHEGVQQADDFLRALLAHDLLEPFVLEIQHHHQAPQQLAGFYTLHEERLAALGPEALVELHQQGHLQPLFMMLASQAQFPALLARHQRQSLGRG